MLTLLSALLATGVVAGEGDLPTATADTPWGGHDQLPTAAGEPTTLFVNFDGAVLRSGCGNDAHLNCSSLADAFDGYVGPFGGTLQQKAAILDSVRGDVADFGIRVVASRPTADIDYTMVLYGDLGPQGFAGIAPYIDCGDVWKNDTSFSVGFTAMNQGATVILQEAAHTWGLEHVDGPTDILNPVTEGGDPAFTDMCLKIVSNTALDPSSGVCNTVHTRFCGAGEQNSHRELLYLFGPPIPDDEAPTVEIVSPADGSIHELPAIPPLRVTVSDNLDPQSYYVTIVVNGTIAFQSEDPVGADLPLYDDIDLAFMLQEPGDYELEVEVEDEAGNLARASASFAVVAEGELEPELEQGCAVTPSAARVGPGLLLLLSWTRRRRRVR